MSQRDYHLPEMTEEERDEYRRRYAHDRDTATEWNPDDYPQESVTEWIETIINAQIDLYADTGASELCLHEPYSEGATPNRYRLRLRHPDTCVSDVSMAYDAGEMEAYLRGLEAGVTGRIERESGVDTEPEGVTVGDVQVTEGPDSDGVMIHHDGENRSVLLSELRELADSDEPVEIR